ncbi:uncharacterized protein LOC120358743 [Solenopsis invicta]|uniref:uncharacterized protein LOC120358743 n=1 Tax=Solenopsis invicta TaxID=13686 RepID=UPI00193DB914|nr:uncharacterized protein LOC120358743 [Solenopsis invicta]
MGPEYAHRNYRLCHLHFEEKWYKIGKSRANLHPDAIPTIFFGTNNTSVTSENVGNIVEACQEEETSRFLNFYIFHNIFLKSFCYLNIQSTEILPMDTYADIAKPLMPKLKANMEEDTLQTLNNLRCGYIL